MDQRGCTFVLESLGIVEGCEGPWSPSWPTMESCRGLLLPEASQQELPESVIVQRWGLPMDGRRAPMEVLSWGTFRMRV